MALVHDYREGERTLKCAPVLDADIAAENEKTEKEKGGKGEEKGGKGEEKERKKVDGEGHQGGIKWEEGYTRLKKGERPLELVGVRKG